MGPSGQATNTAAGLTQQQQGAADIASKESQATYKTTAPGLSTAENYYQALASGNPAALFKTIAPAVGQINQNSEAAANQIKQTTPRGGAQDLALQQNDITKAANVGNLATNAFTSSFPALASLAGTGLGLSTNEMSNAIAGLSTASQTNTGLMNAQAEGKASTMGMLGSLTGGLGDIFGSALGAGGALGCWVAEMLWGKRDDRTLAMRFWLLTAPKSLAWRMFAALYMRFGQRVAIYARDRRSLKWILRLLLGRGLVHAEAYLRVVCGVQIWTSEAA